MMNMRGWCLAGLLCVAFAGVLRAGDILNAGFETEFGSAEDQNVWGDFGEAFGEAYIVDEGNENGPKKAHKGSRALLINVPADSWNGVWQQIPWDEKMPFTWTAWCMITGGELAPGTATFMKAEFMDGLDQRIGEALGESYTQDTGGKWVKSTIKGVTPPSTRAIRFVLIAGSNPEGEPVMHRIFWDDSDTVD